MSGVGYRTHFAVGLLAISGVAMLVQASNAQSPESTFTLPPPEEFNAIVDRPLFSPDRKPPENASPTEASSPAAETDGDAPHQIVLAGTATDQANRAVAILHDVSQGIQFRVWVGDQVDGWRVKEIRPRTIVLATATEEVTVTLDEPALPAATEEP
jgi:hypothetical protein